MQPKILSFFMGAVLAFTLLPAISYAQSCSVADITQEISYEDTINSSGSPLDDAFAVFQQDRFYVNQQGRLDASDQPDSVMVTREARANYGQAIKTYLQASSLADRDIQSFIGLTYVVSIEVCYHEEPPSIRVISIQQKEDIPAISADLIAKNEEIQRREDELSAQSETLRVWEAELVARERDLDEWQARLERLASDLAKREASIDLNNEAAEAIVSRIPGNAVVWDLPLTSFRNAFVRVIPTLSQDDFLSCYGVVGLISTEIVQTDLPYYINILDMYVDELSREVIARDLDEAALLSTTEWFVDRLQTQIPNIEERLRSASRFLLRECGGADLILP